MSHACRSMLQLMFIQDYTYFSIGIGCDTQLMVAAFFEQCASHRISQWQLWINEHIIRWEKAQKCRQTCDAQPGIRDLEIMYPQLDLTNINITHIWLRAQLTHSYWADIRLRPGCQGWVVSETMYFCQRGCQEAFWLPRKMGKSLFIPYMAH